MKRFGIVLAVVGSSLLFGEEPVARFAIDFDKEELGLFEPNRAEALFGPLGWETLSGRASVDMAPGGEGRALRVRFPAGKIGSEDSGASFVANLAPVRRASLEYTFRFGPDFPFSKGGKLPGLGSGGSRFTGGRPPGGEGGWSARYMWRTDGELELYFYHPNMKDEFGERHRFGVRCEPERTYRIRQFIDVGDPGKENGTLEVWVNGESRLRLENLALSGTKYGPIDTILFAAFFGGGTKDWAPRRDGEVWFDEFVYEGKK